jgi:hypothetical protein
MTKARVAASHAVMATTSIAVEGGLTNGNPPLQSKGSAL